MARAERLYIAGRLAQLEGEQRVLQIMILHALNAPARGIDHLARLGAGARRQIAPRFDGGVQVHMHAVSQPVVMIHQRAAVYKAGHAQRGIGVDDRALQHKAARPHLHRRADDGRRVHDARHTVARLRQAARPRKAQTVIAKGGDRFLIPVRKHGVIHALAHNLRIAHRVVQKGDLLPAAEPRGHLAHHAAKAAHTQDQQLRHMFPPVIEIPHRAR